MRSIKNGNWSDPATWDSSGGDREIYHRVVVDKDMTCNERVFVAANSVLDVHAVLTMNNKNLVCEGVLYSRPNGKKRGIKFININEQIVVGGGMAELLTDVGLWFFMAGRHDVEGSYKTPWTNLTGSAKKGDKTITVKSAAGWNVGDEIVVVPTETSWGTQGVGWDDRDTKFSDRFFEERFEKRIITQVSGNAVSFLVPLLYDHFEVRSGSKIWTAEVANLTRDFVIEGTPTGRAHIFHTAHNRQGQHTQQANVPHNIKNIEGRHLGQRKGQGRGNTIITGRYGLHFHHNGDGTQGTVISGCSFHQIGNRCYVPHMSNGILMKNNIVFDCLAQGFWWDDRENSHDITWDGNLIAACRPSGDGMVGEGALLGMGDNNRFINNALVYCNGTDIHNNNGGIAWNANSEGVWIVENNLVHSSSTALFVWQNTGNNHTIVGLDIYNCLESIQHGAYINSYGYYNFYFYNAPLFIEASSGNSFGVVFKDGTMDGAGKKYCMRTIDSPAGSHASRTNKMINVTFLNYTDAACECASELPFSNPEKQIRCIDFISCNFSGTAYKFVHNNTEPLKDGYLARVQPKTGQAFQTLRQGQQDVTSNIPDFAAKFWGTGTGLKGEYYQGTNFDVKKFERIDSMIMFQGWRPDPNYATYGVHHLLQGDLYSIRWTGEIEPQFSEATRFHFEGSGGHRLWIDGKLIVDSWVERAEANSIVASSAPIGLTQGKKVAIKIEHFNSSGERSCQLFWESASMGRISIVPSSQLYFGQFIPPPPPTVFKSARKTKDFTRNNCPAGQVGEVFTYSVDAGQFESTISQADADAKADADILARGQNQANQFGTCKNINMPVVANAGADKTVTGVKVTLDGSLSTGAVSYKWYVDSGPNKWNIVDQNAKVTEVNELILGEYVFLLVAKDAAGNESKDTIKITVGNTPVPPPPPTKTLKSTIKVFSDGSIEVV